MSDFNMLVCSVTFRTVSRRMFVKDCGFRLGLFLTVDTLCSEGKGIGVLE